jgi:DNA processing protein
VAVLGSGADQVYPSSNRDLARRILECKGLLVTEYPPGTGPLKWNFPARNRIISALARGTVIVEAPEKSGALITARFALEQNRDLWVDRVGLESRRGKGTARLAEEGAGVISSAGDILAEWNMAASRKAESGQGDNEAGEQDKAGAKLASSMAEYLDIKL